jgi:hypothetical protein
VPKQTEKGETCSRPAQYWPLTLYTVKRWKLPALDKMKDVVLATDHLLRGKQSIHRPCRNVFLFTQPKPTPTNTAPQSHPHQVLHQLQCLCRIPCLAFQSLRMRPLLLRQEAMSQAVPSLLITHLHLALLLPTRQISQPPVELQMLLQEEVQAAIPASVKSQVAAHLTTYFHTSYHITVRKTLHKRRRCLSGIQQTIKLTLTALPPHTPLMELYSTIAHSNAMALLILAQIYYRQQLNIIPATPVSHTGLLCMFCQFGRLTW